MFSVPERNTGKSFERPAKYLRGLQRFGKNLRVLAGGAAAASRSLDTSVLGF